MIKLKSLIKENSTSKYNFGCAMLYFNFPYMRKIHALINPEDVYHETGDQTFGLEDESHVTLLYGLHPEVSNEEVASTCKNFDYDACRLHNASTFNSEKYDVLKFDVENPLLHDINKQLRNFPHTSNFPEYHPHMTIAYLKPGMGKKYVDMLSGFGLSKQPSHIVYSQADGTKHHIPIKINHFK